MPLNIEKENNLIGSYDWKILRGQEAGKILQGYLTPQHVKGGEQISIHTSSSLDNCEFYFRIFRLGWYRGAGARQVFRSSILSTKNYGTWSKEDGFENIKGEANHINGMNWPILFNFEIPSDWTPGCYIVKFSTLDNKSYLHPFWVCSPKKNESNIAIINSMLSNQSRNWWGGENAMRSILKTNNNLDNNRGANVLSFHRPHYNPRGGDELRWNFPLIKWLEKNGINVAFHTDLELETDINLLEEYSYVITTGPMRFWTENTEKALKNLIHQGNHLVHLGSEAGQHIVALEKNEDGFYNNIYFQKNEYFPNLGPRLKNLFFSTKASGKNKKAPWKDLKITPKFLKHYNLPKFKNKKITGLIGSSWDKTIKNTGVSILTKTKFFTKKLSFSIANSHIRQFPSNGTIFNAGVSNWTWALEEYSNQGNVKLNKEIQMTTFNLIGLEYRNYFTNEELSLLEYKKKLNLANYIKSLIKKQEDFELLLETGIHLWETKKYKQAQSYFEKAIRLKPTSPLARYRLARNYHKLLKYEPMLPLYEELISEYPENMTYRIQYCDLLINLQDFEKAIIQIQNLEDKSGNNKYPDLEIRKLTMLSTCFLKAKRLETAEKYCINALEIDSENIQALVTHARIAHNQGDYFLAEKRWKLVLEKQPTHYSAIMGIARACFKRGDFVYGEEIINRLISDDQHKHRIWPYIELINLTFNQLKDYEYTVRTCHLLFENVGEDISNHRDIEHIPICHLALSLSKIGKSKEAIDLLNTYLLEHPDKSEYLLALSQIYRERNESNIAFNNFNNLFGDFNDELCDFKSIGNNLEISVQNLVRVGGDDIETGPLVSVIMTAFKATELIEVAINSILNQTFRNIELIVVDDASPDDTFQYINNLAKLDSRILPIKLESNGGTYIAKNHGLLHAKGKYVAFHDSDDWCHPDKIRIQVERLEENKHLQGVTTGYVRVDEHSNIIYRGKGAIRHACISLMFRRKEVIDKLGYFDSVRVSADSEFERRIHTVFGKETVEHIHLPFIIASVSSESLSGGGKFAMDWTGLSGPRLEYRRCFELFHDKIRLGKEEGYIPFPLNKRVFDAPNTLSTG